ncbi:hypothetical protein N5M19_004718 [Salmonella enterica subsp. enterica serovar Kentucky]|nr:hypothetical protein [Salmonella enterica subsp. enterica serovar Kentucky]EHZ0576002.1 hypothetical protein [Salmonella enterica]EHO1124116.1 hypothetical protein [Salmonella enterica subsp. enterica serovar Kentucky]EIA9943335.1 hypothetical protein [Salmonella enterica subsp. enterica serovar Kentucky]EIE7037209.1 hypothetical protein [Salmonella enterica subsp. enterica serovar Kentucky]
MSEPRLGNLITVLLPARSYKINCALTTEKLMPGIEQFACRLLLIFDQLYPSELQNYFGLTDREREVLLDGLLANRLININPDGHIEASSFLRKHAASNGGKPSLVKYQERTEEVAFDLLTLSICKPQPNRRFTSGLPELLPRHQIGGDAAAVTEAFSSQFRHHLLLSRNSEYERQRTRLYKIMGCSSHEMVQLPIEIEVSYDASAGSIEPQKFTRSYEYLGNTRLPLSNELEAHIADFLGEHKLDEFGIDCEDFCKLANDKVLSQFANGYKFDYSGWIEAREQRKTGYGTSLTTGMLGAVYLPHNSKLFISMLHNALRDYVGKTAPKALWYSSKVPLWGANGRQLSRFTRDLGDILGNYSDDKIARISLLHPSADEGEKRQERKRHLGRFPTGIGLTSEAKFDRLEILLIPDVIALVQYHGQPNSDSALTMPIGYVTVEPERLELLKNLMIKRIEGVVATINWSESKIENLTSLLPVEFLIKLNKKSGEDVDAAIQKIQIANRAETARAILSLRK